ncbi:hypothetical protein EDB86DRAFT_2967709 [Lactarius hatsudake]|nr:hypothetical protein EDB86DRAFT_2967709 [Lactarius hatsudake]
MVMGARESSWSCSSTTRRRFLRGLFGVRGCLRKCVRFVGNGMTTSTLVLSLEASARVSVANRRVVVAAGADADAITLGYVELCVNAAANPWSRGLDLSLSSSSSSSSSTSITVSFAAFFVIFPLGPVLPAPGQLFSNATCNTYTSSIEPELSPAHAFHLAAVWRWRCRDPYLCHVGGWEAPTKCLRRRGRGGRGASLTCGVRVHGIARARSAWRHPQEQEEVGPVARRMHVHRMGGVDGTYPYFRYTAHLYVAIRTFSCWLGWSSLL